MMMTMTIIAITTKLYSWKIIYLKVLQVATSVVTKAKQIASYPINILLLIIINRRRSNWNQRLFLLLLCCKKNKKNPNINKIDINNLLLLSLFGCNRFHAECIHCIITGGHHGTNLSLGYKFSCIKFNGNIVYFTNDNNHHQNGNDSDINNNDDNEIHTTTRKVRRRLPNKSIDCTGFSFSSNYVILHYCQIITIIIITTTIESFIHFCKCLLQIEPRRIKKSSSHNHTELFVYLEIWDMYHCSCENCCDNCDISIIISKILSGRRNYNLNLSLLTDTNSSPLRNILQNFSLIFKLQQINNFPATNVANLKLFESTRENFPIFFHHCNNCYRENFRFQSISVLTITSVIISTVQIFDNPCGNSCSRTYPPTTIDQTAQSNLLLSMLIVNFIMGQTSTSSCCQRSRKIYFCSAILPHLFHCFHQSCRSCLIIVFVSFSDRLLYLVLYGDDNILCGQQSQNTYCPVASNNNQDKISGKSFLQLHQWWLSDAAAATSNNNNELTKFVSISTKNVDIIFFFLFRQVCCSNNNNNNNKNNNKKESIYYVKNNKPNNNDYFDSNDFFQHRHQNSIAFFFFFFFLNVVELKPNLNNKNIQIMNMTTKTTMIIFQTCHHQVASFTSFDFVLKIYLSFNSKNNSITAIAGSYHEQAKELLNFCTVVNYDDDENEDKYNFQCKEFIMNKNTSNDYYDYCDYCGFGSYCGLSVISRRRLQPDDDDDDNIHHASLSLLSSCNYLQSKVCLNFRNQSHRGCATAICLDFFLDRFYSFPSASSLDSIVIIIINIVAVVIIIIVVAIMALILPTPSSMLALLLLKSMKMKMMRLLMEQKSLVPLLANQKSSSRCSDTSTSRSRHQWMMRSNSSPHHLLLMTIQRMLLLLLCCLLLLLLLLLVDCRLAGYTNWEYDAAFATITIMAETLALALDTTTTNRTNGKVMRNVVKNANSTNATSNTTTTILDAKDDDADNNGNNNTDDDDSNERNNNINSETKPKPLYAMNINELAMILWIVRLLLTMAKNPVKQSLVVLDEPTPSSNIKTKTNTKIWHHSVLVLATIGSKVKFTFISISTTPTTTTTTIAVIVIIAVYQTEKKNMQIRQTIVFLQIWLLGCCYCSTKSKTNFAQSELPLVQLRPFVSRTSDTIDRRIRNVSKSIRKSNPRNLSRIIYSCCLYTFSYCIVNNIIRTLLLLLMPKYNNKSIIISLDTTNEINRLNNRLSQQKDNHGKEESFKNSNYLFAVKEDDDLFAKFSSKIWQIPMPKLEQQQWKIAMIIINYSNFIFQILLNLIFKFYNLLLTSFLSYCYNKFCQLMYLTIVRLFIVPMSSLIIGFKRNPKIFNKSKFIEYCANYFWLCNRCLVLIFFYEKIKFLLSDYSKLSSDLSTISTSSSTNLNQCCLVHKTSPSKPKFAMFVMLSLILISFQPVCEGSPAIVSSFIVGSADNLKTGPSSSIASQPKHKTYPDLNVLIGTSVQLPCDLSLPEPDPVIDESDRMDGPDVLDETAPTISSLSPSSVQSAFTSEAVQLVLWYHGDDISGSPFYSVDARANAKDNANKFYQQQTNLNQYPMSQESTKSKSTSSTNSNNNNNEQNLKHFVVSPYTDRAQFDIRQNPPLLQINPVTEKDSGLYWCRVDYRWTRTTISKVRLNVLVPPKQLSIYRLAPEDNRPLPESSFLSTLLHEIYLSSQASSQFSPTKSQSFSTSSPSSVSYATSFTPSPSSTLLFAHQNSSALLISASFNGSTTSTFSSTISSSSSSSASRATSNSRAKPHSESYLFTTDEIINPVVFLDEGIDTLLGCQAVGGNPLPNVAWFKNNRRLNPLRVVVLPSPVDSSSRIKSSATNGNYNDNKNRNSSSSSGGTELDAGHLSELHLNLSQHSHLHRQFHSSLFQSSVTNQDKSMLSIIEIKSPNRADIGVILRCQATNTNSLKPIIRLIKLDVNLRPTKAHIVDIKRDSLTAGSTVYASCLTWGSRPAAKIRWLLDGKELPNLKETIFEANSTTKSVVRFVLSSLDNGKQLRCIAENPNTASAMLRLSSRSTLAELSSSSFSSSPSLLSTPSSDPASTAAAAASSSSIATTSRTTTTTINKSSKTSSPTTKLSTTFGANRRKQTKPGEKDEESILKMSVYDQITLMVKFLPNVTITVVDDYGTVSSDYGTERQHQNVHKKYSSTKKGSSQRPDSSHTVHTIKSNQKLTLHCAIDSNPAPFKIRWLQNRKEILPILSYSSKKSNNDNEMFLQDDNQTLVIKSVSRIHEGKYQCVAYNALGRGDSKEIAIFVLRPPRCAFASATTIESSIQYPTNIFCQVDSNPMDNVNIYWQTPRRTFLSKNGKLYRIKNSELLKSTGTNGEANDGTGNGDKQNILDDFDPELEEDEDEDDEDGVVGTGYYKKQQPHHHHHQEMRLTIASKGVRSRLTLVPQNARDFGIYKCWAENSIGSNQQEPCLFNLTRNQNPSLLPKPVENCRANYSYGLLSIRCRHQTNLLPSTQNISSQLQPPYLHNPSYPYSGRQSNQTQQHQQQLLLQEKHLLFHVQIYQTENNKQARRLIVNQTNPIEPVFLIQPESGGTWRNNSIYQIVVYVSNLYGISDKVTMLFQPGNNPNQNNPNNNNQNSNSSSNPSLISLSSSLLVLNNPNNNQNNLGATTKWPEESSPFDIYDNSIDNFIDNLNENIEDSDSDSDVDDNNVNNGNRDKSSPIDSESETILKQSIAKPDLQKQNRLEDVGASHRLLVILITVLSISLIVFSILLSITIVMCVYRNKRFKNERLVRNHNNQNNSKDGNKDNNQNSQSDSGQNSSKNSPNKCDSNDGKNLYSASNNNGQFKSSPTINNQNNQNKDRTLIPCDPQHLFIFNGLAPTIEDSSTSTGTNDGSQLLSDYQHSQSINLMAQAYADQTGPIYRDFVTNPTGGYGPISQLNNATIIETSGSEVISSCSSSAAGVATGNTILEPKFLCQPNHVSIINDLNSGFISGGGNVQFVPAAAYTTTTTTSMPSSINGGGGGNQFHGNSSEMSKPASQSYSPYHLVNGPFALSIANLTGNPEDEPLFCMQTQPQPQPTSHINNNNNNTNADLHYLNQQNRYLNSQLSLSETTSPNLINQNQSHQSGQVGQSSTSTTHTNNQTTSV